MITIIVFVLVLSLLVFVHELGHFVVSRRLGVKVEEFGMGFPPRAIGAYKDENGKWVYVRGNKDPKNIPGTLYSFNWVPLGGFCKIKGEDGAGENDPDSFANKKVWKRTSIVSAGVIMNFILAAVLLSVGFMIGLPQVLDGSGGKTLTVKNPQIQVSSVLENSSADKAGIEVGDIIESVNGNIFVESDLLSDFIAGKDGESVSVTITRGDEVISKTLVPSKIDGYDKVMMGVSLMETGLVYYPWYKAIYMGFYTAAILTKIIVVTFYGVIRDLIVGVSVETDIAGPVGIAVLTGQVTKMGFVYLLQFTALLSLNLAIINFLPFPALDGGRIIFFIIEKIRGRAISSKIENTIHNTGFALLMVLVIFVTFHDVSKFKGVFIGVWQKIVGFL